MLAFSIPPGETRCRYIFRYYDADGDTYWNYEDFRRFITDVRKFKHQNITEEVLDKEVELALKVDEFPVLNVRHGVPSECLGVAIIAGVMLIKHTSIYFYFSSNLAKVRASPALQPILFQLREAFMMINSQEVKLQMRTVLRRSARKAHSARKVRRAPAARARVKTRTGVLRFCLL